MDKQDTINNYNHGISLLERKNLVITGVKKIENFDSEQFLLDTIMGFLMIKGEGLELIKLDTMQGNVSIKGLIHSMTYIEDVKKELLEVNNLALEGKPEDMVITSHICRGNYHSTFFTSGPYDSVADYVFAKENVDALFLEYDDARSGGFAPLAKVSPDKKVVLGLITTKTPQLEEKEVVIKRIHEAAKYIPLDRLYLSPQCGFASCEIGNKLTEEEQWAKLKLVKEIAEEVWGE